MITGTSKNRTRANPSTRCRQLKKKTPWFSRSIGPKVRSSLKSHIKPRDLMSSMTQGTKGPHSALRRGKAANWTRVWSMCPSTIPLESHSLARIAHIRAIVDWMRNKGARTKNINSSSSQDSNTTGSTISASQNLKIQQKQGESPALARRQYTPKSNWWTP